MIDGVSEDSQDAELWLAKFKGLYNHCDPGKRDSLLDQLHSAITRDDLVTIAVDSGTVVGALKHLKLGKSDGRDSLLSCFVMATQMNVFVTPSFPKV